MVESTHDGVSGFGVWSAVESPEQIVWLNIETVEEPDLG
jgi:hypothetical protein